MPTGNLPSSAKKIWEKVYQAAKADGDSEEKAAKKAWGAVKQAGWKKDENGNWHKKALLEEFSMVVKKASIDPKTGDRLWRAETSDTGEDHHGDNMTIRLFNSFIEKIESQELAPEQYRSDYWQGGIPYLSISHYSDLNGDAVPGVVDVVYIDGSFLKAKGKMNHTQLGDACWKALCDDMEKPHDAPDKIRVSIAFLDYMHKHKSNGYEFERKSLTDICPECLKELISGEYGGKEFLDGQLIQLAMTRVPANERTLMEVEKSMATQKEDAATIIGDEEAERIDELEKQLQKSEVDKALVIKAKEKEDEEDEEEEMDEEEEKKKKDKEMKSDFSEILDAISDIRSEIESMRKPDTEEEPVEVNPLDEAFSKFKSAFAEIEKSAATHDEKLMAIQSPFEEFGREIVSVIKSEKIEEAPEVLESGYAEVLKAIQDAISPLAQKVEILSAKLENYDNPVQRPQRRSISPSMVQLSEATEPKKPLSIKEISRKSVGL